MRSRPRGEDDVQVARSLPDEHVERASVAVGVLTGAEERNGLVPELAQVLAEYRRGLRDLRDRGRPSSALELRLRSQSVTTLSKSACSVWA